MREPQHPARPAFADASDQMSFMVQQLGAAQRAQYDEFVKQQEREKEEQKLKADRAKAAYDQAREKHPQLVRNYDPPFKIKDPHLKRLAVIARSENQKVTALERSQAEDKLRYLEKLDKQREEHAKAPERPQGEREQKFRENARDAGERRSGRESALSRAFAKAEAKDQSRDKARSREPTAERGHGGHDRS